MLVLFAFAVAGCGDDAAVVSDDSQPFRDVGVDDRAAELVPSDVRDAGVLKVAMAVGYPPNEFFYAGGETIIGMDPDLARAIGQRLGLETEMVDVTFEAIVPKVRTGEYLLTMSSFTITPERRAEADMVSYFLAGTGFFTNDTEPKTFEGLSDLCGESVAIVSSTIQVDDARRQSRRCVRAGSKGVDVNAFQSQDAATDSVRSGESAYGMADSPVAAYIVKQSGGALVKVGEDYGLAPYGALVNRKSRFAESVRAAIQSLIDDGTYLEILDRWGLASGAIKKSSIYR